MVNKLTIEEMYYNMFQHIFKSTAIVILNGKKLKAFPLGLEIRQECLSHRFYSTQYRKS